MALNYADFPDPPSQSTIRLQRGSEEVVLSTEPPRQVSRQAVFVGRAFFWVWNGAVLLMMGFGVFMCWMFLGGVLRGDPGAPQRPLEIALFGSFFLVWFGVLAFFLLLGLRMGRVVSGKIPLVGFRMVIQQGEWQCTRYQLGKAVSVCCDPRLVRALVVDAKRRLVAELYEGRAVLTGPLTDYEADWLRRSLGEFIGLRSGETIPAYPFVPSGDLSSSPGTTLAFRLPTGKSAAKNLLGCFVFTLIFNAAAGMLLFFAIRAPGWEKWFLILFLIPFGLAAVVSLIGFVQQLLVATGVGKTIVELAQHPLYPGQKCRGLVLQAGRLSMNSLRVLLVCREQVSYRQGTNCRTETRQVYQQELFSKERFEIDRRRPLEADFEFEVPPGAMHSFEAAANRLEWRIVVQGDVARWPDFKCDFPVVVYPPQSPGSPT